MNKFQAGEIVAKWKQSKVKPTRFEKGLIEEAKAKGYLEAMAQVEPLVEAARGLSFGTDWNNGTHAKLHGYRQKLLDALRQYDALQRGEHG